MVSPAIIRLYCLPVPIYQVLFKSRSFISKTACINILLERGIFISLYYNIVFCSRKFVLFLCLVIRDLNIATIRTAILISLRPGILIPLPQSLLDSHEQSLHTSKPRS